MPKSYNILAYLVFSLLLVFSVVDSFCLYGVNYGVYINGYLFSVFFLCMSLLLFLSTKFVETNKRLFIYSFFLVTSLAIIAMSTRVHLFGGDGAVSPIEKTSEYSLLYFQNGKLIINRLSSLFDFCVLQTVSLFDLSNLNVMRSIFIAQVSSWVAGFLAILSVFLIFRKSVISAVIITSAFMFNFFGNIDNYAFSVLYSILFFAFCYSSEEKLTKIRLVILFSLWGIGMWVHPTHIFWGFLVIHLISNKYKINTLISVSIYGILLFTFLKLSPHGAEFYLSDPLNKTKIFGEQPIVHCLNSLVLPYLPLLPVVFLSKAKKNVFSMCLFVILGFLACVWTLGVSDQFNYNQILAILILSSIVMIKDVEEKYFIKTPILNLLILLPMAFVHSNSELTCKRALNLYPKDISIHNIRTSWETHLGLVMGDNCTDKTIKRIQPSVFLNGSRYSDANFRFSNYIYYICWKYNYGDFQEGKILLSDIVNRYPQSISFFFSDRPGFIFFNSDVLFKDLVEVANLPANQKKQLSDITKKITENKRVFFDKNPYKGESK